MSNHIPRLEMESLRPDLAAYLEPRVNRLGYLGELFKCAGNAPEVILQFMHFTDALKEALPDRLTELGALTVASFMENRYERHQHERLCVKLGFSREWIAEIERLDPKSAASLSDVEQAAQIYAIAALNASGIGVQEEFGAFASLVTPSEAVAFAMLIGRYVTHALVVNTLQLAPPVPSIFEE
ncbi:carboxymuconolactone decarboxylase family protein [Burkholderia sp. Tr-862]|uniref:carboxymuconolactone decarboxylase family protein n=1 Tax=Burkholderia sp. Tr-862 TaxID=2608331 RepID=UPI00141A38D7|nr:carboxymuconolactone decarboxylase family protein [Burkholderia sp. Tr-862]NIF40824.1 carboxymuconolactone decarboxylase family protein [Burkholderia sp. Tr-862]